MRCSIILLLICSPFWCCTKIKEEWSFINEKSTALEEAFSNEGIFACEFPTEPFINAKEWQSYLTDHLVLDSTSIDSIPAGSYTALIRFEIDENGKLANFFIQKDPGHGLGKRVKDVIAQFNGRWTPSQYLDRKVKSYRVQPVTFLIEE